eukprot:CAMPEP_0115525834 /NCGR_PEP_ID=MMETSP0271-20121206/81964_1 /TAXON_ID=71861 /ORGANISM="Scrippsiella trochoidea, Strain CCMP3099" /LENGTH=486 /DNA_ID=CAMNT_0002957505 /DNA_START=9 /DNA_END=1469 /DNA_ORIENTATION=+
MTATVVLLVLNLLGFAIYSHALRVRAVSTKAASAAFSEVGLFDTFNCCCREEEANSCDHLAVTSKGGRALCCHATHSLICPSNFSSRKKSCFGPDVPLYDRLRAYKYMQVLDPDTFGPAKQGESVKALGSGFSGTVYLARSRASGQLVAIKMAKNKRAEYSLTRECERAQKVHASIAAGDDEGDRSDVSSHVVRCLAQEKDYKPPFVALEYAGRPAVRALAAAKDHVVALQLLKQVFLGLRAMQKGVPPTIHHDLKWDNVAVADDGCLKIIDLDSATKGVNEKQFTRGRAFTEAFAPPELNPRGPFFACGASGGESNCPLAYSYDTYSAGIMAASVLCGAPEFYGIKILQDPESNRPLLTASRDSGLSGYALLYDAGLTWALYENVRLWSIADQARMLRNWTTSLLPSIHALSSESWKRLSLQLHSALESKLSLCESASNSSASAGLDFSVLDWMRTREPEHRPRPQEVLDSALFHGIDTGCSRDA